MKEPRPPALTEDDPTSGPYPISGFLDWIASRGFSVGVRERIAFGRLVAGWPEGSPRDLADAVAALLGKTPDEQLRIRNAFLEWVGLESLGSGPGKSGEGRRIARVLLVSSSLATVIGLLVVGGIGPGSGNSDAGQEPHVVPDAGDAGGDAGLSLPLLQDSGLNPGALGRLQSDTGDAGSIEDAGDAGGVVIPRGWGAVFAWVDAQGRPVAPSPALPLLALAAVLFASLTAALVRSRGRHSAGEERRAVRRRAPGPRLLQWGRIARSGLPTAMLDDVATAFTRVAETGSLARDLDVERTIRESARGLPAIVWRELRRSARVLWLQQEAAGTTPHQDRVNEVFKALRARGVPIERWSFGSTPLLLRSEYRKLRTLRELASADPSALLVVVASAADWWAAAQLSPAVVGDLRLFARRVWIDPCLVEAPERPIAAALPLRIRPMTPAGLQAAADDLRNERVDRIVEYGCLVDRSGGLNDLFTVRALASLLPDAPLHVVEELLRRTLESLSQDTFTRLVAERASFDRSRLEWLPGEAEANLALLRSNDAELECKARNNARELIQLARPVEPGSIADARAQLLLLLQDRGLAEVMTEPEELRRIDDELTRLAGGMLGEEVLAAAVRHAAVGPNGSARGESWTLRRRLLRVTMTRPGTSLWSTRASAVIVGSLLAVVLFVGGGLLRRAWQDGRTQQEQVDATLAAAAEVAAAGPIPTQSMLATSADAVARPLSAGRKVPAQATRALANALLRTSGQWSFDQELPPVTAALSADRKVLLEGGARGQVLVREAGSWALRRSLQTEGVAPTAAALNRSGTRALVGFKDGRFKLWDTTDGHVVLERAGAQRVAFVALSADGDSFVVARSSQVLAVQPPILPGWHASAELWDVIRKKKLKDFSNINAVVFIGHVGLAIGRSDGVVDLRGLDGELLNPLAAAQVFTSSSHRVDALVLAADRLLLAALRDGRTVEFIPVPGTLPNNLAGGPNQFATSELPLIGAFSADGANLAFAETTGHVQVLQQHTSFGFDICNNLTFESVSALAFLTGLSDPVLLVADSTGLSAVVLVPEEDHAGIGCVAHPTRVQVTLPGEEILLVADLGEGHAVVVTTQDVREIRFDAPTRIHQSMTLSKWQGLATKLPLIGANGLLLLPAADGWDLLDSETGARRLHRDGGFRAGAFAEEGGSFVVLDAHGTLTLFDGTSTQELDHTVLSVPPEDHDLSIELSPDATDALVHGAGLSAWWDRRRHRTVTTGLDSIQSASSVGFLGDSRQACFRVHEGQGESPAVIKTIDLAGETPQIAKVDAIVGAEMLECGSRAGLCVAASAANGVAVLGASGMRFQSKLEPGEMGIFNTALFVSPDVIVAGGRNGPGHGPLFEWSLSNGVAPVVLTPEMDELITALSTPGGASSLVAAGSLTGSVVLWDVGTHEELAVLSPPTGDALEHRLMFTPQGGLLHAESDGSVELLPGTPARLLALANARRALWPHH